MEYVPVPNTENQSAQSSDKPTDSTFSPEAFLLSQQMSQQLALQNNSGDEIDLAELWHAIWTGKLTIIVISFIFAVASIAFALSKPDVYKASVLLSPASNEGAGGMGALGGQLGGLASLAGVNLGGGGTDKTSLALEIIKSRSFLETYIAKHNLLVPLMAAAKWDRINEQLILDNKIYDEGTNKWLREASYPKTTHPSPWETYQKLLKLISVSQDKNTSLITIGIEFYSPVIAKQWLVWLVADVNDFMRVQDEKEAQSSIDYLTNQLNKTEVSAMETVFYQLIEEQTKNMMLTKVTPEYVLKTVDPAQVPDTKAGPKRAFIVVLGTILGGVLSVLIVLIRYFFNKKN
jgi:LPS O-antigen subunit length determinant protein (WzzB/FepE family)